MTSLSEHKNTIRLSDENRALVEAHMKEHGSTLNKIVNIALSRMFKETEKDQTA